MDFALHWYDVTLDLQRRTQPIISLERPHVGNRVTGHGDIFANSSPGREGEFWVPFKPINQEPIEWSLTTTGELVRVPMHAYQIAQPSKALIFGLGMELGMRAGMAFANKSFKPPKLVTLVLGTKVDLIDAPDGQKYVCYAGLAIQV
jgi:hypothetical protein